MPGIRELKSIRLKRESTNGTPVAPNFQWRGNGESIDDQREVKRAEEQVGIIGGTDRTYVPKILAAIELAETEATYEQLSDLFIMAGFATSGGGNIAGTAYGASGSAVSFTLVAPTFSAPTTNSYTVEAGDSPRGGVNGWAERMEYTLVDELKLSFKGAEAMMVSASMTGRQGTPINTLGTFSNDGTIPAVETILASMGTFYLSPVGSGFGSQQVTAGNILSGDLTIKTTWTRKWPVDAGRLTFATAVFTNMEISGELTLEHQISGTYGAAGSAGQVEKWRSQQAQLLTMVWPGGAITEGTTYANKFLQIGIPIKWETFDKIDDMDGNDIRVGKFFSAYNLDTPAAGRGTVIIVRQGTSEFAGA